MQQYPVWASKDVEVLIRSHAIHIYLKLETWARGGGGGGGGGEKGRLNWRGFREGDKGIRVREW